MTPIAYIILGLLGWALAVLGGTVLYCRAQLRLDELEIRMLRSKVTDLEQHPAVRPRPRTIVKHRRLVAVSDDELDTTYAREAAQHAAARERHEK